MFSNICNSIASQLTTKEHTVSIAESSTGGLIAANLLSVSGASRYFKGGSVIYTRESRHAFLDLDLRKVKAIKPLTEPMAAEFAHAARISLTRPGVLLSLVPLDLRALPMATQLEQVLSVSAGR